MSFVTLAEFSSVFDILKAILDILTFLLFIGLVILVIHVRKKNPILDKHSSLFLRIFLIFGSISSFMDALDEFLWFTSKYFYNTIWKPTKLFLLFIGLMHLVIGSITFFRYTKRFLGEDLE